MRVPSLRTIVLVAFALIVIFVVRNQVRVHFKRQASTDEAKASTDEAMRVAALRQGLFDQLRPVALTKCRLARFGEPNDGGYLMCANLLNGVKAGYSYGISGYDKWGCDVSTTLKVPLHQYDCFNLSVPVCSTGNTVFHAECVAGSPKKEDGRIFDSIAGHIAGNGDEAKHVVLKIDVEGAEWESFLATPDAVLQRIDQLVVEFHGLEDARALDVVKRLKRFFHVAHIHFNNFSCVDGSAPFPTWAYEVSFVNTRLDTVDTSRTVPLLDPLDAPNNPRAADCPSKRP